MKLLSVLVLCLVAQCIAVSVRQIGSESDAEHQAKSDAAVQEWNDLNLVPECPAPTRVMWKSQNPRKDPYCGPPEMSGANCDAPYTPDVAAKLCVAPPPYCGAPLDFHPGVQSDGVYCTEPIPTQGDINHEGAKGEDAVLDNSWVQPVIKDYGDEDLNKPGRIHQEVLTDEDDKVLQKDRHTEEEDIWDFEVNRISTAH